MTRAKRTEAILARGHDAAGMGLFGQDLIPYIAQEGAHRGIYFATRFHNFCHDATMSPLPEVSIRRFPGLETVA